MKALAQLLDLSGQSAIVTGGGKGIGAGIAYRLAEAGALVIVADIDYSAADETAQRLDDRGWQAVALKVDVADDAEVQAMIATCKELFGSVDILVNNAGIYPSVPLAELSADTFDAVMRLNLRSVFLATKYAAEVMKPKRSGSVINITSIDAVHPSTVGLAHYDASKHGEWGFTKSAALELAPFNIRVNAIAPGAIRTPGTSPFGSNPDQAGLAEVGKRVPLGRIGEPDDIGTAALFLASEMSRYMTGSQIVVDGGNLLN